MPKKGPSAAAGSLAQKESSAKQRKPDNGTEESVRGKKPIIGGEKAGGKTGETSKGKEKSGNEIDEIFSTLKKRNKRDRDLTAEIEATASTVQNKPNKKKNKVRNSSPISSKPRRRTGDGLAIYSAEELGFGRSDAGGTPLCPFDCDCCF